MTSPFVTITNNLTSNRCWLCEQTFPRGLTKRVFQVQDLLDYFLRRYNQEKLALSSESENSDSSSLEPLAEIRTKNFADCYARYKADMDANGNTNNLLQELRENDLDAWMSGLICGLHGGCDADSSLFIKSSVKQSSEKPKPRVPIGITFANKDCPPDCGCDNPWAFLS